MKTGMQPAMKISLVRRDDAESPGIIRQNTVSCMVSRTCTKHEVSAIFTAGTDNVHVQNTWSSVHFPSSSQQFYRAGNDFEGPVRCTSNDTGHCTALHSMR